MAKQTYVGFDFDHFDEKGLATVVKELESNGLKVTDVTASNKARRQSGVLTKEATFHFADGQKLTLKVTAQGAVFQVRLNTRVIPVTNVHNLKKAITEIANKVQSNSKQFQAALRRKIEKPKINKETVAKTSTKARLAMLRKSVDDYNEQINTLNEKKSEVTAELQTTTSEQARLEAELKAEQERTAQLQAELDSLKAA